MIWGTPHDLGNLHKAGTFSVNAFNTRIAPSSAASVEGGLNARLTKHLSTFGVWWI